MSDLEAIRARDASEGHFREGHDVWPVFQSVYDRRTLLAYVDELRAAARKVTCMKCAGQGTIFVVDYIDVTGEFRSRKTCPDCADLRGLLQ